VSEEWGFYCTPSAGGGGQGSGRGRGPGAGAASPGVSGDGGTACRRRQGPMGEITRRRHALAGTCRHAGQSGTGRAARGAGGRRTGPRARRAHRPRSGRRVGVRALVHGAGRAPMQQHGAPGARRVGRRVLWGHGAAREASRSRMGRRPARLPQLEGGPQGRGGREQSRMARRTPIGQQGPHGRPSLSAAGRRGGATVALRRAAGRRRHALCGRGRAAAGALCGRAAVAAHFSGDVAWGGAGGWPGGSASAQARGAQHVQWASSQPAPPRRRPSHRPAPRPRAAPVAWPTTAAGEPATSAASGTGFSTTEPAAMWAPRPMVMLPSTRALAPTTTWGATWRRMVQEGSEHA
jgi:hypothetical protein